MLGFVVRLGCAVLLLVVSIVLALILTVLAAAAPTHAAGWAAAGPLRLAAARPDAPPAPGVRGVFLHGWVNLPELPAGCAWRLAGDAAGRAPFRVDDRLTLIAHLPDGRQRQWSHDFRAGDHIVALPPTAPAALGADSSRLEVQLEDVEPPTWGNSDVWLVPCPASRSAAASPLPTGAPLLATLPSPTRPPFFTNSPAPDVPPGAFLSLRGPHGWLALAGLGGSVTLLVLAARVVARRRPARAGAVQLLTVYDAAGRPALQQAIHATDLPLGIMLDPLRLVPGATPGVLYLLGFPYPGTVPVLFCRQPSGVAPLVLLDGDRLAQVTIDREANDGRATSH